MDHLSDLQRDGVALVDAAEIAGLDAPVPTCPGWDIRKLLLHTARVHQRTEAVVRTGASAPPPKEQFPRFAEDERLFDQFRSNLDALVDTLRTADPNGPSWNFSRQPHVNSFWSRRMANETSIHRFDAERAIGRGSWASGERAVDGIDELLVVHLPLVAPAKRPDLNATVHLHCSDHDGEWLVTFVDGVPSTVRAHAKGDLAVRGPAPSVFLWAWNRLPITEGSLEQFGPDELVKAWAELIP